MGKYVLDYKLFEEDQNVDITDELKDLGKGLQNKGDDLQDMIAKLADSDPDIKKKKEEMEGDKDRDNEEETQEKDQEENLNEGVLTGLALSSGAILSMVGKFMKLIGKRLDKKDESRIYKVGQTIDKIGHNIHHKIIDLINLILKPLIFWMPKKKQQGVSNVVFMCILALKVSSGSFDPSDYKTAASMTEGLLNSIKATEIGGFIKDNGKNLLKFVKMI